MTLLLDTQVLLWCLGAPERLSKKIRRRIESASEIVFVSVVSAWELEVKRALGKLDAPTDLPEQMADKRFTELTLRLPHIEALRALPPLHRDPFDRMLIAQSISEDLVFVTADAGLRGYPAKLLPA
jgi:PIN domain nuclease of toxin-antitoxin system